MNVAPGTLDAIIRVESGGNPLALHVNKLTTQPAISHNVEEAAAITRRFIASGYSVDIGIMQVNSRNLPALGYTIEDALDPCRSIAGGAAILTADYSRAVPLFGEGQGALQAALSAYNTGSFYNGSAYVRRVTRISSLSLTGTAAPPPPNPLTADTVAYSREDIHVSID